jgi:hypothetical protein
MATIQNYLTNPGERLQVKAKVTPWLLIVGLFAFALILAGCDAPVSDPCGVKISSASKGTIGPGDTFSIYGRNFGGTQADKAPLLGRSRSSDHESLTEWAVLNVVRWSDTEIVVENADIAGGRLLGTSELDIVCSERENYEPKENPTFMMRTESPVSSCGIRLDSARIVPDQPYTVAMYGSFGTQGTKKACYFRLFMRNGLPMKVISWSRSKIVARLSDPFSGNIAVGVTCDDPAIGPTGSTTLKTVNFTED